MALIRQPRWSESNGILWLSNRTTPVGRDLSFYVYQARLQMLLRHSISGPVAADTRFERLRLEDGYRRLELRLPITPWTALDFALQS